MRKFYFGLILLVSFTASTYSQHIGAGFQVGLNPPIGIFADEVTTGFGAQGNFNWIFNDHLNATASVGYFTFVGNNEIVAIYPDYKFYTIPITLGLKYIVGNGDIKPFALAELGIHITNSSYLVAADVSSYYVAYKDKKEYDETSLGASLGGGILVPFDKTVSFETALKFTSIAGKEETKYFFSILAGITVVIRT